MIIKWKYLINKFEGYRYRIISIQAQYPCINPKKQSKKKYQNSGVIHLTELKVRLCCLRYEVPLIGEVTLWTGTKSF